MNQILTTVTMEPTTPGKGRIYEGRAIPVRIQMRTSFAWAGDAEERTGKMVYDIVPLIEDWLVIGVKRGYYLLEVSYFVQHPGSQLMTRAQKVWLSEKSFSSQCVLDVYSYRS
jgi:hypothetical protein